MTLKKWIDIVPLKEFYNVLSIQELAELSMSSKLFRSKLLSIIYKTLKLDFSEIENMEYKSYEITEEDSEFNDIDIQSRTEVLTRPRRRYPIIDDSDEEEFEYLVKFFTNPYKPLIDKFISSRERFRSDLKLIPYQPSVLIIYDLSNYCYFIREISDAFNSLKALHIDYNCATLEDFQYLLDNLKCLEILLFTYNYIFKCNSKSTDYSISWPKTLKELTIGGIREMILNNNHDPIRLLSCIYRPNIPMNPHLLMSIHLPNLESLSLVESYGEFDDMLELLKVNSHIKRLYLPCVDEIHEIFDIIQSFKNLNHLNIFIDCFGYKKDLEKINSQIPPNFKSLTVICNYYYDNVINFLKGQFHQLTHLSVRFKSIQFQQLSLLISNLTTMHLLKKLELHFEVASDFYEVKNCEVYKSFRINIFKFPKLSNLESVEFRHILNSCYNIKMDLGNLKLIVDSCPKLKRIGFSSEDNLKYFGEIGSEKLGLGENWKLISTPSRYLLHKVDQ
ncbi:hypothetical protein CONCODRAFT_10751 [Conidiobolus coronatus NRRL 28638]|uniref:Uncharacterized protein n=1 Tax=Conidiobolus coronatus (strain ATCC 28846 / CBS 209.66 / NRRL 28638) TaxID=796925 RepID=A0A137NWM9_CONC2|nr:hypothetical protein CONCODRAFT_10751 [Conidiobolus coronatus NRRL 28638]|eukprot:KXN67240.1 hypothetical protein CONCODRAFT_10751 [Conidiobolus coronatus NRRL 28638]